MWRATDAGDHCTGETCPWESSAAYELDGDCGRELTSSRDMCRWQARETLRSGREKRARTDDDDSVEGDPLLDDVSEAGREGVPWGRFVTSPNACRFAA